MASSQRLRTPENVERFVTLVLLGIDAKKIQEDVGIKKSTYYVWLKDEKIITELESRRQEIRDEGMRFVKARYKKYLGNIDSMCDDKTDRRSCLAANIFMIEKIDGKNTARLELTEVEEDKKMTNEEIDTILNKMDKECTKDA